LPWNESIKSGRKLVYMSFLQKQLDILKENGFKQEEVDEQFVYSSSSIKPARIGNMLFSNDRFRKVRLTYFDAGDAVQVFNSLWYPRYEYDLPLFGVDLISLNKNRVLSVVDYQPLHPTKEYSAKYIDHMKPIEINILICKVNYLEKYMMIHHFFQVKCYLEDLEMKRN